MTTNAPIILGIETSCDETGIALVQGSRLLGHRVASSLDEHARFGGVIPEIASRAHVHAMLPTLQSCLDEACLGLHDVDAVAVTAGPGLIGSLSVGVAAAKALAWSLDVPIYGVNHVLGHLAVDRLVDTDSPREYIGLVVSGGHSSLFHVRDIATDVTELGASLDDAAGEAFDKVGRLLGLPYPGGPHIDRLARKGDPGAIDFPRALMTGNTAKQHRYNFSFSGLKTAVSRYLEANPEFIAADVAASFSAAVSDVLVAKTVRAAQDFGVQDIVIGGGFSANSQLRERATRVCTELGLGLRIPPLAFCTDNGAMIAAIGEAVHLAEAGPSELDFYLDTTMTDEVLVGH